MSAVPYRIRRSERARRVRVTVDVERGVEVVLPRRAPDAEAADAVAELRPWIERRMAELGEVQARIVARGDRVPYLGTELALVAEPGRRRVHRRGDALHVPAGDARPALERWYRRAAHREVLPRLDAACAELGRSHAGLTIRGQRTRWASCSSSGAMSFNWRLLLAPEPVLDYVVRHEAAHLVVPDHSPRFWALVERLCPDHRLHSRWLRRHGAELLL